MKVRHIPKRNGGTRTIVVPGWRAKQKYRELGRRVTENVALQPEADVIHGFMPGRSPVTNALAHAGYRYTISFDLKDFFDTVTLEKVVVKMPPDVPALRVLYKPRVGAPYAAQGLPSSPAVANLATLELDRAILRFIDGSGRVIVYTRYADDLTFSFNLRDESSLILQGIPDIIAHCGFQLNPSKTKKQSALQGRRIITGVAVDDKIHPTRKTKRRLRAALHQGKRREAIGLAEWAKCKLPRPTTEPNTPEEMELPF